MPDQQGYIIQNTNQKITTDMRILRQTYFCAVNRRLKQLKPPSILRYSEVSTRITSYPASLTICATFRKMIRHDDVSVHPDAVCCICFILRNDVFVIFCEIRFVDELSGYQHVVVLDDSSHRSLSAVPSPAALQNRSDHISPEWR